MPKKIFYWSMSVAAFALIALAKAGAASACNGTHYQPELPQHLRKY